MKLPSSPLALAFAFLALCAAAPAVAQAPDKKPLRWAADAEGGAPYIYKDPQDLTKYVGFEVDIADALEKALGRKLVYQHCQFSSLVPGLDRGDFELAMNGLEVTPDRLRKVRFSKPYYVYQLQLVGRKGETRFASLDDLAKKGGLVVGTLEDTSAERLLDKLHIPKKTYEGQAEPYTDLALGRIDAVLLDLPIALYLAQPNPALQFIGPPETKGYYAIALKMNEEALAKEIDAALDQIKASGELRRILEKWKLWNPAQEELQDLNAKPAVDLLAEGQEQFTFFRYFPQLLRGAGVTVFLTVVSFILAMILGLPIALGRLYGPFPVRWLAMVYVEFFRGIPVLLLIFFLYFFLPDVANFAQDHLGLNLSFLKLHPMVAAILGFGLNYGAYEAEIYRAGISSVPVGQWEASATLGMTPPQTFRRIVLPQALRVALPPMTNDFIALFKDTSVVSIISIVELSKEYQILAKSSFKYVEIGLATAALYLVMSVPLGYLSRWLEKRWQQPQ